MRVLYLANNRLGLEVLRWLRAQGEQIVGVVVHPPGRERFAQEIREEAHVPSTAAFLGPSLRDKHVVSAIEALEPDVALSIKFGYLLQPPLIHVVRANAFNLHTGLLPFNRGAHPNVWSIVEGTPAGVTLHHIDAGIDTGDIIAQRQVTIEPVDTGSTLYEKLEQAALELFCQTWPAIRSGATPRHAQSSQPGTHHRVADLQRIEEIDLDRMYQARDLINLLRARTFLPYPSAFFVADGRRVSVRISLEYDTGSPGSPTSQAVDDPRRPSAAVTSDAE